MSILQRLLVMHLESIYQCLYLIEDIFDGFFHHVGIQENLSDFMRFFLNILKKFFEHFLIMLVVRLNRFKYPRKTQGIFCNLSKILYILLYSVIFSHSNLPVTIIQCSFVLQTAFVFVKGTVHQEIEFCF